MTTPRLAIHLLLLCATSALAESPVESERGVIRDEKCAMAVGAAILRSVYGEEKIGKARFRAELVKGEWQVSEDLPTPAPGEMMFGGGYHITLSPKDGRVLLIGFDE